jgi:hypothetical protein
MPEFDPNQFNRSAAGQLLRRLAESESGGAPASGPAWNLQDLSALHELERLGYVRLQRGAGAMSWKIVGVEITEAGRRKVQTARG